MAIDLAHVPIIDQHCHGLYLNHSPSTVEQWRPHFTESADQVMRIRHVADTLYYRRLTREFASFLGCEPSDEAVIEAITHFIGGHRRHSRCRQLDRQGNPIQALTNLHDRVGLQGRREMWGHAVGAFDEE